MEISQDQLVRLADAFGLVARACKKVKSVLTELAERTPIEVTAEGHVPSPEVTEVTAEAKEGEGDDITTENFCEKADAYLRSKQMVWGARSAEFYFIHAVRSRLRANNLKFVWAHRGGALGTRKNWKKISVRSAERIFERIKAGWEELIFELTEMPECPKGIRNSKWGRRNEVLSCKFPETLFQKGGFKKILVDLHDDLPALK